MNEIIDLQNFILATRDSGYKHTASALSEIIDNSLDAGASSIMIEIGKERGNYIVSVLDNGKGMSAEVINLALKFGGSTKFNSRQSTGRFGMGLPNASLSQTKRVDLYSWTSPNCIFWNYIDVDEVATGEMQFLNPAVHISDHKFKVESYSGTLVKWSNCDRLSYKNLKSLITHLHKELGRIFRKFIYNGIQITINGKSLSPIDPLFQNNGKNLLGGIDYGESLKYDLKIPGMENNCSTIWVKFVELPIEKWHTFSNEQKNIYGITKKAGISILRAGREIDFGWFFMGSKRKENYDDWWRCEISFNPDIDELFGITHTKQEIHPSNYLKQILTPDLELIARKLNTRVRDRFIIVKSNCLGISATRDVEKVDHFIKPPKISSHTDKANDIDKDLLFKKEVIRGLTYYLKLAQSSDFSFFQTEFDNEEISILLNKNHPFYDKIYLPLVVDDNLETQGFLKQLEILIFAAARSESLADKTEQLLSAIHYRKEWGKILATFLS